MANNFLLVHVFKAFLPPREPDEGDYYEILGHLSQKATLDNIRKAYKVKSLQLHPDKVTQRGEDATEAAAQYEKVQEAYGCLSDAKNRQKYHQLSCSPTWYRFVVMNPGGFIYPVSSYQNVQRASCVDKTRLVGVVVAFLVLVLLQPILVAAKVNQSLSDIGSLSSVPWIAVLTPLWIFHGSLVAFMVVLSVLTRQPLLITSLLENVCWLAGEILLAKQWDIPEYYQQYNWHLVSIPFYLALIFRIVSSGLLVIEMLQQQMKMISPDKLRVEHPEWTEDEFMHAEDQYCIVTVDEESVAHAAQLLSSPGKGPLNEEDMEALRIQFSSEYKESSGIIKSHAKAIFFILVLGFTFVAIVAAKLENQVSISWWTAFFPLWIYLGQNFLYFLLVCCCLSTGDPVIVSENSDEDQKNSEDNGGTHDTTNSKSRSAVDSSTNFASPEDSMNEMFKHATINGADKITKQRASIATSDDSPAVETHMDNIAADNALIALLNETINVPAELNPIETKSSVLFEDSEAGMNFQPENVPKVDENTFRAWQHAQAHAESSAMEHQAKASGACCLALFQLTMVCLIVGKLQRDYDQPDPSGYNAFWVLFPIFFVVGVILCCFICLIYGVNDKEDNATHDEESPVVPEVGAPQAGAFEATENTSNQGLIIEEVVNVEEIDDTSTCVVKVAEKNAGMDDLD